LGRGGGAGEGFCEEGPHLWLLGWHINERGGEGQRTHYAVEY
jgi:hypothetical protein